MLRTDLSTRPFYNERAVTLALGVVAVVVLVCTVLNVTVARVMPEQNLVLLRGAVPGANGALVMIRKSIKDPWREVSWDEAISYAAGEFKRIQAKYGKYSIGGITSSRCTN